MLYLDVDQTLGSPQAAKPFGALALRDQLP